MPRSPEPVLGRRYQGGMALGHPVAGHDDAHVVTAGGERERERAGDVGEAARLGERNTLRDDEEYL